MSSLWNDFKKFAVKGNVMDLAVGIIIGAAFTSVVNSLVNDIIMPPIGAALGGVDFSNIYINLSGGEYESLAAAQEAGAATVNIGLFINALINFLIVAFAVFMLVRSFQRLQEQFERRQEAIEAVQPSPEPTAEEKLTVAITRLNELIEKKM